jgi:hypothetical protein
VGNASIRAQVVALRELERIGGRIGCLSARGLATAGCGAVGFRLAGRVGAVFAAEQCNRAVNQLAVCQGRFSRGRAPEANVSRGTFRSPFGGQAPVTFFRQPARLFAQSPFDFGPQVGDLPGQAPIMVGRQPGLRGVGQGVINFFFQPSIVPIGQGVGVGLATSGETPPPGAVSFGFGFGGGVL